MTVSFGDCEIVFLPCDDLAYLAERIQGSSFSMLVADEMSAHPDNGEVLLSLLANLRHPTINTKFIGLTNPGNHAYWVHRKWLQHSKCDGIPFTVDGMTFVSVHTTMRDNPHLNHEQYEAALLASVSGNQTKLREMRDGIFGLTASSFFNIPQEAFIDVPPGFDPREFTGWKPVGCLDYRASAPFYFGLFMRATQNGALAPNGETYPKGSYIGIGETHSADPENWNKAIATTDIAQHCKQIYLLCEQNNIEVATTVADSQIFAKIGMQSQSDTYKTLGVPVIKGAKPHNTVSLANLQTYLSNAKAQANRVLPGLYLDKGMRYLIHALTYAPPAQRNTAVIDPGYLADHPIDAVKYMVSTKQQGARSGTAPWEVDSGVAAVNAAAAAYRKREKRARAMGLPSANSTCSYGRNYRK